MNIYQTIKKQAVIFPDKTAFQQGCNEVSYAELVDKVEQLSSIICDHFGGKPQVLRVGILLDKNFHLLVALLSALHAGVTYIPIDPNLPDERIKYMLADASIEHLITSKNIALQKKNY
ncbi:MAG: AMP-binding protein [Gammaproteobacteria bacterium]|nr:AMP-binding protein [Gammaproteobacteria bacterium]